VLIYVFVLNLLQFLSITNEDTDKGQFQKKFIAASRESLTKGSGALSGPFRAPGNLTREPRASALRPQPWARFWRPFGPRNGAGLLALSLILARTLFKTANVRAEEMWVLTTLEN
jgi:hypothetical protein